jgi:hypothetical protein
MTQISKLCPTSWRRYLLSLTLVATSTAAFAQTAPHTRPDGIFFQPGNLVISRSVYDNNANAIQVGEPLPPNCTGQPAGCGGNATYDGTYPLVWNNDLVDASFGITSRIELDQYTPAGQLVNSVEVPNSDEFLVGPTPPKKDQLVTSFSSKSEIALNLSTDGTKLTFMGYVSPVNAVDISNSNTPGILDPTNQVVSQIYRAVADVDVYGMFHFTETRAYSGNNGRAAILNNSDSANYFYLAGNAGNGGTPQPDGIIIGAGAQFVVPSELPEVQQNPPNPSDPLGSFNITQLGDKLDKVGKDTNFRGLTIFNNVVYYTKGSGGNGVNTVYWLDPTLQICNDNNGIGLPPANATLPTMPLAYNHDHNVIQSKGLDPNNMCVLKGFPTALKSKTSFPFGIWFADGNTLYVADEGNGDNTYSNGMYTVAAGQKTAGLQKWIFDPNAQQWNLAYTLQKGLNLGVPYTVPGYPSGDNPGTNLPWSPGTDGLRNITGIVNNDGTATIYAVTSTVSGNGDQGADPNMVVVITDLISATQLPPNECFNVFASAKNLEVLRGVSFTPTIGDKRASLSGIR